MRFSAIGILFIALLLTVAHPLDTPAQTCLLGKPYQSAHAVSGLAVPGSKFKLVVDPATKCSNCPAGAGFRVTVIDMVFQVQSNCNITVRADVERIAKPGDPGYDPNCPDSSPGQVVCQSAPVQIALGGNTPIASVYPTCACLPRDGLYLLSFEIIATTCSPEANVWFDGIPFNCSSWYNDGSGWIDLTADAGIQGGLRISGDAMCCSPPVPVEESSWGAIKALYEL